MALGDGAARARDGPLASAQHVQLHIPRSPGVSAVPGLPRCALRRLARRRLERAQRRLGPGVDARATPLRALGRTVARGRHAARLLDVGPLCAVAAHDAAARPVLDARPRARARGVGRLRAHTPARGRAGGRPARAPAVGQQPSVVPSVARRAGLVHLPPRPVAHAPLSPRRAAATDRARAGRPRALGGAHVRDAARVRDLVGAGAHGQVARLVSKQRRRVQRCLDDAARAGPGFVHGRASRLRHRARSPLRRTVRRPPAAVCRSRSSSRPCGGSCSSAS